MRPGEPEQEVSVLGGQVDRFKVNVHITFIILTVFLRIGIMKRYTQESWSKRCEYLMDKGNYKVMIHLFML